MTEIRSGSHHISVTRLNALTVRQSIPPGASNGLKHLFAERRKIFPTKSTSLNKCRDALGCWAYVQTEQVKSLQNSPDCQFWSVHGFAVLHGILDGDCLLLEIEGIYDALVEAEGTTVHGNCLSDTLDVHLKQRMSFIRESAMKHQSLTRCFCTYAQGR